MMDSRGRCPHHPFVQLQRISQRTGQWISLLDACPVCKAEDEGSIASTINSSQSTAPTLVNDGGDVIMPPPPPPPFDCNGSSDDHQKGSTLPPQMLRKGASSSEAGSSSSNGNNGSNSMDMADRLMQFRIRASKVPTGSSASANFAPSSSAATSPSASTSRKSVQPAPNRSPSPRARKSSREREGPPIGSSLASKGSNAAQEVQRSGSCSTRVFSQQTKNERPRSRSRPRHELARSSSSTSTAPPASLG